MKVAQENAKKLLAEHQPPPLDKDVVREIQKILKRATKTLVPAGA